MRVGTHAYVRAYMHCARGPFSQTRVWSASAWYGIIEQHMANNLSHCKDACPKTMMLHTQKCLRFDLDSFDSPVDRSGYVKQRY